MGHVRHLAIFLLAMSAIGPALILERALPGYAKALWLILTGLPWLGVLIGGWIRDDAQTLRVFRLGTGVELGCLTWHLAQALLGLAAFGALELGGDRGFILTTLIGGVVLSMSWLALAVRVMRRGPAPTAIEAATQLRAGAASPTERAVALVRVIGGDTILVALIGLGFVAAAMFLIARDAGGELQRPQWIFTLVFFGLAAATAVWVGLERYRAFVPGASPGRAWTRPERAALALAIGALLGASAILVPSFPTAMRVILAIAAALAVLAGLVHGLGLGASPAKIALAEEGLEERQDQARVVFPWASIQAIAIGEQHHQLCLTLTIHEAETAIRAASASGAWIERRLRQLRSTRRWYGADLAIFASQVELGLADLATAIRARVDARIDPAHVE